MPIVRLVMQLRRALGRRRRDFRIARLSRRLALLKSYSFTADWFSGQRDNWTLLLAPYAGRPGLKALEIGSYEGRSTIWLLENILTDASAEITCVDHFHSPGWEPRFDHNIRVSGAGQKVRKIKGASQDLLGQLPRDNYDIIYVDGSHTAGDVLLDALLSWRLLRPGGIMIFDDYLWERQKPPSQRPQLGIDFFLELFSEEYELLHMGYQVAVRKRS